MVLNKVGLFVVAAVLVAAAGTAIFVASGVYNVAADVPHTRPVHALLESVRENSIARRAAALTPPELTDAELIRQGSGNYDAMCMGCHLAPGMPETELSKGLYPTPPPLAKTGIDDPAAAFWAIKHGIKATGMPAWGKSMEDGYIWGMVAFLQQLPKLDAEGYRNLVASSGGHSHGGGETVEHEQAESTEHEHAEPPAGDDVPAKSQAAGTTHHHADGSTHIHPPKTEKSKPTADHQH